MGWIIIIFIGIVVLLFILNASSSRRGKKHASPWAMAVMPPMRSSKEIEIRRSLDLAYTTKQRLTMKYETGFPEPGEPAIKVRDIDIYHPGYGLGEEYFDAYCHYRGEVRTFKKSRVLWARLTNGTYQIPRTYVPSTWVTEGWGEIEDSDLESIGETSPEQAAISTPRGAQDKYRRGESSDNNVDSSLLEVRRRQQRRVSEEAVDQKYTEEVAKTHTRYDRQKRFEESILTPFPTEWSPAFPYLCEAYRLELEGADKAEIDRVLEKARQADKDAMAFYLGRLSIIKKVRSQRQRDRQKE